MKDSNYGYGPYVAFYSEKVGYEQNWGQSEQDF